MSKTSLAQPLTDVKITLPFMSAEDFIEKSGGEPDWIIKPFLATQAMTEIDGKAKVAGKTSFVLYMIKSILRCEEFMGYEVKGSPVVWLTEERGVTFCQALHRAALGYERNLFILEWHETFGMPWPEIVAQAAAKAHEIGAKVLVIDTFPQFAKLLGDKESQSGAMLEALHPVQVAASSGLSVIMTRHDRKSGGEVGDSGRGSTAFAGAMDVIMRISRPAAAKGTDNNTTPLRHVNILSRFEGTPSQLIIRWTGGEYDLVDVEMPGGASVEDGPSTDDHVSWDSLDKVLTVLPLCEQDAITISAIKDKLELGEGTVRRALAKVDKDGLLRKIGKGTRTDPFIYYRTKPAGL
jgi:hypothetical protein